MSPRRRHLLGEPSPHDSRGSRDRGDLRRPLGTPSPAVPYNTRGPKGFAKVAGLVISVVLLAVLAAAVYVALAEKQPPAPPPNQPTDVAT